MNKNLPEKINSLLCRDTGKSNFLLDFFRSFRFKIFSQRYFTMAIITLKTVGKINLSISFKQYSDDFGIGYKNTLVTDLELPSLTKRQLVCTGYASNAQESIRISIAETTERLAHFFDIHENPPAIEFSITTSGCAFHTNSDLAAARACAELIERDGFLVQWFGSASLIAFATDNITQLEDVRTFVHKNEGQLYLHHFWNDEFKCHSITLVAHFPKLVSPSTVSFFCGLGGHPNFLIAINDAKKELIRFIRYGFGRPKDIEKELASVRIGSSMARFLLFQKPEYQFGYLSRIQVSNSPVCPTTKNEKDILAWYYSVIKPSRKFQIRALPLLKPLQKIGVVMRATNDELQYLDFSDESIINEKRITSTFGHGSVFKGLHFIP